MAQRSVLKQELTDIQRAVARLADEIKAIQGFIAADERNIQHSVEAIRVNARQSLDNYRTSLASKQTEMFGLQQELQTKQAMLGKLEAIARKEQEVQQLEREKARIVNLHEKARADLGRLEDELEQMARPASVPESELILGGTQRVALPADGSEVLVGCLDAADGIFPDIDLTPFGGTASGVSRKHATIGWRHGQWTVTDQHSTNGTFVNETRLAPYVPKAIQPQSVLRFGTVVARFALKGAPAGKTTRLT